MAVDYGRARTGVALSDPSGVLATPLTVLESRDRDWVLARLKALAVEHQVGQLVVGLALNMDGSLGPSAVACQDFAAILARKTGLPVELVDERLSTVEAERLTRGKTPRDAAAAAIILQEWLDCGRRSRGAGADPSGV